uniref:Uncharacterized protein n=1 Tax=Arundo donax TaxID=35708 RepID=A0A0A8Y1P5_ARUDO
MITIKLHYCQHLGLNVKTCNTFLIIYVARKS